jgi:LysR family transcriptional regulator, glycine cleavage system transcriptional activator
MDRLWMLAMHDLPPLPWLRTYEVSARHLSFTAAAQELGLSQAAVSKQIKLLELKLGEPLFIRLPRSLKLTMAGEAFLPKVRDAFERLASGADEVFGPPRSDILTVRAATGFAVNWLAPRLPDFMKRHPHIALRLISSVWNEEDASPVYDLDIRYGDGKWAGEHADRLTYETIQPVCSPALLSGLKSPQDLRHYTLIHVLGYKEGWALWLKAAGVDMRAQQPALQLDTSLLAFEMAAAGAGIAMGRSSLLEKELRSGRLVAPFALQVPVEEAFYLVTRDTAENAPHAMLFKNWLLNAAKKDQSPEMSGRG